MTALLEHPLVIGIAGGAAVVLLFYAWLETGRKRLLQLLPVVALVTVVLLLVERLVQTEREAIRATLHEIARHVELNDVSAALDYFHTSSGKIRDETEALLKRYEFQKAEIKRNLRIETEEGTAPMKATATFNAVVVLAKGTAGGYGDRPHPVYLDVSLQKEGENWKVLDYSVDQAIRGFQKSR